MVVREMLQSGNYFVPTVNGAVAMDKPLLSYWAILPFAKVFGLSELTLRIPGSLAAVGVVLFIFVIGRRLFGYRTGLVASLLLLASPMFVLWGKTASADLLNTLGIWAVFWVFLAGAFDGHLLYLMLFYSTGAIASILKGPVAPAVSLASLGLYSCVGALLEYKEQGFPKNALENTLSDKFRWIATRHAVAGLVIGGTIFILMLLAPSIITGSWTSLSLMWKENVVRFFSPFDHKDPFYIYLFKFFSSLRRGHFFWWHLCSTQSNGSPAERTAGCSCQPWGSFCSLQFPAPEEAIISCLSSRHLPLSRGSRSLTG